MRLLQTLFLFVAFVIASGPAAVAEAPRKSWTILVYWATNNDLYEWSKPWLHQLEVVGSQADVNILVQYAKPKRTERYLIGKADRPIQGGEDLIASQLLQTLPSGGNSADPAVLNDFVQWAAKNYPSDHTLLSIGSHGYGWRGVIEDEPHNKLMPLLGIRSVLERFQQTAGRSLDILMFDACDMSFLEPAYAFTGMVQWMIGSPFELEGIDYVTPLSALVKKPRMTPEELATRFTQAYPRKFPGTPETALTLLRPSAVKPQMQMLDFVAKQILAEPSRRAAFDRKVKPMEMAALDYAFDYGRLISAFGEVFPEHAATVKSVLASIRPSREIRDPLSGSAMRIGYPATSLLVASSYTDQTRTTSGVAVSCGHAVQTYRKAFFGKVLPSWSEYCAGWFNRATEGMVETSKKPRYRPRSK